MARIARSALMPTCGTFMGSESCSLMVGRVKLAWKGLVESTWKGVGTHGCSTLVASGEDGAISHS